MCERWVHQMLNATNVWQANECGLVISPAECYTEHHCVCCHISLSQNLTITCIPYMYAMILHTGRKKSNMYTAFLIHMVISLYFFPLFKNPEKYHNLNFMYCVMYNTYLYPSYTFICGDNIRLTWIFSSPGVFHMFRHCPFWSITDIFDTAPPWYVSYMSIPVTYTGVSYWTCIILRDLYYRSYCYEIIKCIANPYLFTIGCCHKYWNATKKEIIVLIKFSGNLIIKTTFYCRICFLNIILWILGN